VGGAPALDEADSTLLISALAFAARQHRTQRRKDRDESAYIGHPIRLLELLWAEGVRDPVTLAAALLHDTVEDTGASDADLRARFGDAVADVVAELTDDKSLDKQRRKELQVEHAASRSGRAKLVKLADKISNVEDILASPPLGWSEERRRGYVTWAARVVERMRGTHDGLEARFDDLLRRAESSMESTSYAADAGNAPAGTTGSPRSRSRRGPGPRR
jgi:guanosine-3',5'-bis(diphosphate) 3'-pyrophosphohydrolase